VVLFDDLNRKQKNLAFTALCTSPACDVWELLYFICC